MKLTKKQGFSLVTAFLFGNVLSGIGSGSTGEKTGYLAVWLSFGIFWLFTQMFQRVIIRNNGEGLFEITHRLFGTTGNRIFLLIAALYSFFAGFLSILNYMDFIRFSATKNFPVAVGLIFVLLLTVYLCLKGVKAMGRYAEVILPVVLISVVLLLALGVREIREVSLPLPSSPSHLLKQGWQIFCSPFSEIIFLWILFDSFDSRENVGKISLAAGLVTTVLFTAVYLFNLNISGEMLLQQIRFPTYFSASLVEVGIIVENAESLITLSYSFCDILYGSLCLLAGVKAICEFSNYTKKATKSQKKITAFSAVIFMFVICIFGKLQTDLSAYYPVISLVFLPFTAGLPVLLFLLTICNNQKRSSLSKKL